MTKFTANTPKSGINPMGGDAHSLEGLSAMTEKAMKTWFGIGAETMRFAATRMQQGVVAQKTLLACKGLEDVRQVQADFYTKALEDYRSQATRMMGMMSAPAANTPVGGLPSAKRGYDDVPV